MSDNGKLSEFKLSPEILARFSPADNTYVTSKGIAIRFRALSPGTLDRVQARFEERFVKPIPPIITIDHGKGRTSDRHDYQDPEYLIQHQIWQEKVARAISDWSFVVGIEVDVPSDPKANPIYEAHLAIEDPNIDEDTKKVIYINSIIAGEEYSFLFEAIVGKASVTKAGLAQAEAEFPS